MKTLLEIKAKTGVAPRGLKERPVLRSDCIGYYDAFNVLSFTRTYGSEGIHPLQVSEILSYLTEIGGGSREERGKALHLVLEMDKVFMAKSFEK